jgi:hypothetical protein
MKKNQDFIDDDYDEDSNVEQGWQWITAIPTIMTYDDNNDDDNDDVHLYKKCFDFFIA